MTTQHAAKGISEDIYKDKSSDSISSATSQFSEVFVSIDNLLFFHSFLKKGQKLLKVMN